MNAPGQPEPTLEHLAQPVAAVPRKWALDVSLPKMKLVAGTQPEFSDETAGLLRSRLQAATLILSFLLAAALVGNFFSDYAPLPVLRVAIFALFVASYLLLRGPRRLSLGQLRWMEAVIFGALLVQMLLMMGTRLVAFARLGDSLSLVSAEHVYLSAWAVMILTYGILMPNTWRRALAVLLPAACLPYGLVLWLRWQVPAVEVACQADKLGTPVPMPFVAVLIAVFGTHVITSIRREAFKAKQLGQYVLRDKLSTGGMGEVYRGEHQLLKRPCAVKLIRPDRRTDAEVLARFQREVQATAKLTHWNTVEIYDYGHADDGTFYYVMELLPGLSLEDLVKFHGPLPAARVVHFLMQVCCALREAHAKGLIHRDIKPANIIAAERGGVYDVAKLLDFGLVREQASQGSDLGLTQPGAFSGSPLYMCPEQSKSYDRLDARSDIYSLGAVAYYLVTGRPPFVRDTIWEVIDAHTRAAVDAPSAINAAVPGDLEAVILRCLAKAPAERYQDMESLREALGQCVCACQWTDQQAAEWWRTVEE